MHASAVKSKELDIKLIIVQTQVLEQLGSGSMITILKQFIKL